MRLTTSTHDERGLLTKKPERVERLNQHLYQKIDAHRDEIEKVWYDPQEGAQTLIVSFGVTARAMQEAVMQARTNGMRVSQLIVHSLFPVPQNALRRAFENHSRIIVPELNHGQYVLEIERIAYALDPRPRVISLSRVDGEMITPQQIVNAL